MINCEKDLEDYICYNQQEFINKLKEIYGEDIKFLGRQVDIGKRENIADLVYYQEAIEDDIRYLRFIIVELKFRPLVSKDLAQSGRYMILLESKLCGDLRYLNSEISVQGLFVSNGMDNDMEIISMMDIPRISYLDIKHSLSFNEVNFNYKEEYIENLQLDKRIDKLFEKEKKSE
mgnify:CR=1 FL=1